MRIATPKFLLTFFLLTKINLKTKTKQNTKKIVCRQAKKKNKTNQRGFVYTKINLIRFIKCSILLTHIGALFLLF